MSRNAELFGNVRGVRAIGPNPRAHGPRHHMVGLMDFFTIDRMPSMWRWIFGITPCGDGRSGGLFYPIAGARLALFV